MKYFLFINLILIALSSLSQNPYGLKWSNSYGESISETLNEITPTNDDGYILSGNSYSNNETSLYGNHGQYDILLIKINNKGDVQWKKSYGGTKSEQINKILPLKDGYILCGSSESSDGDIKALNKGFQDGWLIKIDFKGEIIWEKSFGSSFEDRFNDIIITSDNGFLIVGSTASHSETYPFQSLEDGWVIKVDNSGVLLWEKKIGEVSSSERFNGIVSSSNDEYLLYGVMSNYSYYSSDRIYPFVARIKQNGDLIWSKSISTRCDYSYKIISLDDNGFLLASSTGDSSSKDGWCLKMNSDGTIAWEKTYGGNKNDEFKDLTQIAGGFLASGLTFSSNNNLDAWVVKFDYTGAVIWEKKFDYSNDDRFYKHAITSDNGVILVGSIGKKGLIIKLDALGNFQWRKNLSLNNGEYLRHLISNNDQSFILGGDTEIPNGEYGDHNYWIVKIGINSPPKDILLSNTTINENVIKGTQIGKLSTLDEDLDDTLTYSLAISDPTFEIVGNTLRTKAYLDYEIKSNYLIQIQTKDGSGNAITKAFNISIKNINDLVVKKTELKNPYCTSDKSGAISIDVGEYMPPLSFKWSTGETTQNISNISSGDYSVVINDGENMTLTDSFKLAPLPIYGNTSICYVTSNGLFNEIHVDKGVDNYNVEKYIIYREGYSTENYNKIGEIKSPENLFVDSLINNKTRSYGYKISMIDKCGNETIKSNSHKTIHLVVSRGPNNEINLFWSNYSGLYVESYSIYRQKNKENYTLLTRIPGSNNSYTDFTANAIDNFKYYVSFEKGNLCNIDINLKSMDIIEVKSNTVITEIHTSTKNLLFYDGVNIFPNPITDNWVTIESDIFPSEIKIVDTNGNIVIEKELKTYSSRINLERVVNGIYFIQMINKNKLIFNQKLVKLN